MAWDRSLAPYGYAIDDAEYAGPGRPAVPARARASSPSASPPAGAGRALERVRGELFGLFDARLEPFADALETVRGAARRGVAVAVASSSLRARLDRTLARAGLADAFAVSVAGDEVAHGKPAPTCSSPRPSGWACAGATAR